MGERSSRRARLKAELDSLAGLPINYHLGGEEKRWLDGVNSGTSSPGVPMDNVLWREAKARRIPVLSEIESRLSLFAGPFGRDYRYQWEEYDNDFDR